MAFDELPLTLFTVTAQTAMGAFVWCFAGLTMGGLQKEQQRRLELAMIAVWGLVTVAFCMAAFHLGSPWRFINASFRFLQSPFSNEVVFGAVFDGVGLIGWYMYWRRIGTAALRRAWLWLTLLCMCGFLYGMSSFYLIPTVPTWDSPLTPVAYILTGMMGGSAVAAILFAKAGVDQQGFMKRGPLTLAVVALMAAVLVTLAQSTQLAHINTAIHQASNLVPGYLGFMVLRFALLFAAIGFWVRQVMRGEVVSLRLGTTFVLMLMIGEMVGRGVFYNLHMTVGLR